MQLKSNTPDEVLGSMNQASLTQGVAVATIATAVLMAVLTVGPYLFGSGPSKKKPTKPVATAPQNPAPAASQNAETASGENDNSSTKAAASGKDPKVNAKTLKRLGVDEVKQSDPKKNPLEESVDDLLRDIK